MTRTRPVPGLEVTRAGPRVSIRRAGAAHALSLVTLGAGRSRLGKERRQVGIRRPKLWASPFDWRCANQQVSFSEYTIGIAQISASSGGGRRLFREGRDRYCLIMTFMLASSSFPRKRESRRSMPNTWQAEFRRKVLDSRFRGNDEIWASVLALRNRRDYRRRAGWKPALPGALRASHVCRRGRRRTQDFFTRSFEGMTKEGRVGQYRAGLAPTPWSR